MPEMKSLATNTGHLYTKIMYLLWRSRDLLIPFLLGEQ